MYQNGIGIDLLMLGNAVLIELRSRKQVNVANSDTGIQSPQCLELQPFFLPLLSVR